MCFLEETLDPKINLRDWGQKLTRNSKDIIVDRFQDDTGRFVISSAL